MEIDERHIKIIAEILGIINSLMTIWGGITNNILLFLLGGFFAIIIIFFIIKIKSYPKYTEVKGWC